MKTSVIRTTTACDKNCEYIKTIFDMNEEYMKLKAQFDSLMRYKTDLQLEINRLASENTELKRLVYNK